MSTRKAWTAEEEGNLKKLLTKGMSAKAIATQLDRSHNSVQNKMYKNGLTEAGAVDSKAGKESVSFSDLGKSATVVSVDRKIKTPEDALNYAEVDTSIWEIEKFTVNKFEQGSKDNDTGEVAVVELWQVKVWLKRTVTPEDQKTFDYLRDAVSSAKWKPPTVAKKQVGKNPHLLEISLYDAHFGKLAWEKETGAGGNYNTEIAAKYYLNAVTDLLDDAAGCEIEKILFVVGNDFYNADGVLGNTTGGTPQDNDGRFHRVFEVGFRSVVAAIEKCRKTAPVDIMFIEGNHDKVTGFHLAFALAQLYDGTKDVTVDYSPQSRKYVKYGTTLLGFAHGDKEKLSTLPTLMAREQAENWASCTQYEFHLGHLHSEKALLQASSEFAGVVVRVLPSLSKADLWHFAKGFVKNRAAAQSFLWSKKTGLRRMGYAYAREK